MEEPLFISSKGRVEGGLSKPEDFEIKFVPQLELEKNKTHFLALDRAHLTYSWYNITAKFNNNSLKYSHDAGSTWTTVTFVNGVYSYSDIQDYLKETLVANGHQQAADTTNKINISFINSTYRVLIELAANFQLDFSIGEFCNLLGFDAEKITSTKYGENIPNITNSIDSIYIKCSMVSDTIVDGLYSNVLYVISLEDLSRGLPITVEPIKKLYTKINSTSFSEVRFKIVDTLNRPIDLNGIDWSMNLILKSI